MKNKLQIKSVRIERVTDEDGDSSYLGEFTDLTSPGAIIREGEYAGSFLRDLPADFEFPRGGREYHYFLPAMTGEETGNTDSPKQDWKRMEALNNGDWTHITAQEGCEIGGPQPKKPIGFTIGNSLFGWDSGLEIPFPKGRALVRCACNRDFWTKINSDGEREWEIVQTNYAQRRD